MKNLLIVFSVICCSAFLSSSNVPDEEKGKKVVICHIPPGNPANAHAIEISVNALPAHLAHGDNLGACESQCQPPECECPDGSCSIECC